MDCSCKELAARIESRSNNGGTLRDRLMDASSFGLNLGRKRTFSYPGLRRRSLVNRRGNPGMKGEKICEYDLNITGVTDYGESIPMIFPICTSYS
jgi:hypothetical protein